MTGTGAPLEMVWSAGVLKPRSSYWLRRAEKEFGEGEVVQIIQHHERSLASHNGYFASVEEAWKSLPPLLAEQFRSADHLRYFALIKAGFCHSEIITCGSHAAAIHAAAVARRLNDYAVAEVNKTVVTVFTPKSQSYRTMDKAEFQASKDGVLRVIAEMLDVSKQELADAGKH